MIRLLAVALVVLSALTLLPTVQKGLYVATFIVALFVLAGCLILTVRQYSIELIIGLPVLFGWVETTFSGPSVDIGAGLICLMTGIYLVTVKQDNFRNISLAQGLLVAFSLICIVSGAQSALRVETFSLIPGRFLETYQFNAVGHSSSHVLMQIISSTATYAGWAGLLTVFSISRRPRPARLRFLLLMLMTVNSAVLFVQEFIDPAFLLPVGFPLNHRLNGITSFCYALGSLSGVVAVSAPLWFRFRRGLAGSLLISVLTAAAIWYSGSRTALLLFLLTALFWGILKLIQLMRNHTPALRLVVIVAVTMVVITSAVFTYSLVPAQRSNVLGRIKLFIERDGGVIGHLVATRLHAYPLTTRMILEVPLAGAGPGLHFAEISRIRQLYFPQHSGGEDYVLSSNASNLYLGIAAELGLLALFVFITVLGIIIINGFRAPPEDVSPFRFGLVGGFIMYCLAFLLGPEILNSEAAPLFWLMAALMMKQSPPERKTGIKVRKFRYLLLLAGIALAIGQIQTFYLMHPDNLWQKLRWHIDSGMYPSEENGRWSRPEARVVMPNGKLVYMEWSTGASALDESVRVNLAIDGHLVETRKVVSSRSQVSLFAVQNADSSKPHWLGIHVTPPFVPSEHGRGDDSRKLGIFIHKLEARDKVTEWVGAWPWEAGPHGPVRWIRQYCYFALKKPGSYTFSVRALPGGSFSERQTIRLSANGKKIAEFSPGVSWKEYSFSLPAELALTGDTPYLIQLSADYEVRPSDIIDSEDSRLVAAQVSEPELKGN